MKKFQGKYRVESTRLKGWDYSRGGKYYITIVTKNRVCCFGDVMNGEMRLNEIGKIVNDFWLKIPQHFEHTFLDEHIVMPNHIHGIVVMKRAGIENGTTHLDDWNDVNAMNGGNTGNGGNVETPNLDVSTGQLTQLAQSESTGPRQSRYSNNYCRQSFRQKIIHS